MEASEIIDQVTQEEAQKEYRPATVVLTEQYISSRVEREYDQKLGDKTTAVVLVLKNGFEVIGTAACVDADMYDHEIGKKFAKQRALEKVWELEGYLRQETIFQASK